MADVAGIDSVFIEIAGAIGIFRQQDVPVVMEIADHRNVAAGIEQPLLDFRNGRRRFRHVHGDANEFRARLREFQALLRGGSNIGGIGVGHRLDDHRRAAAHLDVADLHADCLVPFARHLQSIVANSPMPMLVRTRAWAGHMAADASLSGNSQNDRFECYALVR